MSLTTPVRVHALMGRAMTGMAQRAFSSIARCSDRPIHFVVHSDGSLRSDDAEALRSAVGDVDVDLIDRKDADAALEPLLAKAPRCRAFRERNVLALKLLDVPLLAGSEDVFACDTDILAFKRFSGLFDWPDADTTAVFMSDNQNAYALRPWHLLGSDRIAVPARVNTGLMAFRAGHYDLEFVEWFLGRQFGVYQRIPGWVEQTCWAALAARGRCRLYDAAQVRVIRGEECLADDELAIGHFTSDVRRFWDRAQPHESTGTGAVEIRTRAPERLTPLQLAAEQVRRAATRSHPWRRWRTSPA